MPTRIDAEPSRRLLTVESVLQGEGVRARMRRRRRAVSRVCGRRKRGQTRATRNPSREHRWRPCSGSADGPGTRHQTLGDGGPRHRHRPCEMRQAGARRPWTLPARPLVLGRGRGGAARHRDFFWARDRCRASTAARNFTRHGRALAAPVPLHRTRPLHGSKHDRPAAPPPWRGMRVSRSAPGSASTTRCALHAPPRTVRSKRP